MFDTASVGALTAVPPQPAPFAAPQPSPARRSEEARPISLSSMSAPEAEGGGGARSQYLELIDMAERSKPSLARDASVLLPPLSDAVTEHDDGLPLPQPIAADQVPDVQVVVVKKRIDDVMANTEVRWWGAARGGGPCRA